MSRQTRSGVKGNLVGHRPMACATADATAPP
ncbi:MAG: hypothetical protein QOG79_3419, partial [Mycobacterium sp.]|nr:hypothetical protein [Mycobacterium sp.]